MSGCFDLEQVDLWLLQLENGKNPTLLHQIIGADMHRLEGLFTGLEAQLGELVCADPATCPSATKRHPRHP